MKQEYQDYMLQQLQNLLSIDSPSGYTRQVQQYMNEELARLGYTPENPVKGGVRAHLGGTENPILLLAHIDTLGAVVASIKDNGRLMLSRVGGLQANNVEAETCRIKTRFNGEYEGTIQLANASAHVNNQLSTTNRNFEETMEVVLDEDVASREDVTRLGIRPGDFICVEPRFTVTSKGYIKSRFLDDKASAAVLLTLAKRIHDEKLTLKRSIWIGFTVHEEIGHGGAAGVPDGIVEMMSVDMGCVGDGLTCTEKQVSICGKDGGGPYHYDTVSTLISLAEQNHLDYAVDVYPYYTSDVDVSLRAGFDVRHSLIGPGVYASHGYERTHISGLANTFDLLSAYLL